MEILKKASFARRHIFLHLKSLRKTTAQNGWFGLNLSSQNSGGGHLRGSKVMRMGGRISIFIRSPRRLQPFTPPEDSVSQEVSFHHTQISLLIDPGVPRIPIWESPSLWHFSAEMDGGSGINTWSLWEMCIPGLCRKLHSPQISSGVFKKWYPPFHTVLITFWTASGR